MAADAAFHPALAVAGESQSRASTTPLHDAPQLYRSWAGNVPHHPTRAHIDEEHKLTCDAALTRDPDPVVDLLTQHLETTARHLEAIAPAEGVEPSATPSR